MATHEAFHPDTSHVTPHPPARPWWTVLALTLGWTAASYTLASALIWNTENAAAFLVGIGLLLLGAAVGGWFVRSWWHVVVFSAPSLIGVVLFFLTAREMAADYEQTGDGSLASVAAFFIAIVLAVATIVLAVIADGAVGLSKGRAARAQTAPGQDRDEVDADRSEA